ncbi:MAG: hypothetical protein RL406_956, partial [Pseudomonadota bacterium]
MKCDHACAHVVKIHMAKAILFHEGFELLLARVHANGFGQILVARCVTRN